MIGVKPPFRYAVFDFDDTLVNSDAVVREYRLQVLASLVRDELLPSRLFQAMSKLNGAIQKRLVAPGSQPQAMAYDAQLQQLCCAVEPTVKPSLATCQAYWQRLNAALLHQPLPRAPELCQFVAPFLRYLADWRIPVAIVSNSPQAIIQKMLAATPLSRVTWQAIVGLACDKAVSLRRLAHQSQINRMDIVYIGDSFSDRFAALNAGVVPVSVATGVDDWSQHRYPYYRHLLDYFEQGLARGQAS